MPQHDTATTDTFDDNSEQTPDHTGETIGTYYLEELLGAGGSGSVYITVDNGRRLAIKIIEKLDQTEPDVDQVLREAMVSTIIRHPNLVPCLSCGASESSLYLVYELLEGGDTKQLVESQRPLEEESILHLLEQTCGGLHAIHQAGYIHGDIKPSNILLDNQGTARIGDFGTANLIRDRHLQTMAATPAFMAPEQAAGHSIDARADLYALGASCFYWATGRPPFQGENSMDIIRKMLAEDSPSLHDHRTDLSDGLHRLVEMMMDKNPDHRIDTAQQVLEAVDTVRKGNIPTTTVSKSSTPRAEARQQAFPRHSSRLMTIGALVAGLFLGGVLLSWFNKASDQGQQTQITDPDRVNRSVGAISLPWVGDKSSLRERGAVHYRASGSVVTLDGHAALLGDGSDVAQRLTAGPGFRIDMRVRSASTMQQGPAVILLLGTSHASCNLLIGQSRDRLEIRCLTTRTNPDGTRPHLSIANIFTDDRWHALRVERRGQLNLVFVDGKRVGNLEVPGDLSSWSQQTSLCIGDIPRGGFGWQGELSDLRIASLTEEQEADSNHENP